MNPTLEAFDDSIAHVHAALDALERSNVPAKDDPELQYAFSRVLGGLLAARSDFRRAALVLHAQASESVSKAPP